ncbi:MAG: 4Fe-4S binding protein [Rhodocyclaceae bacterium]|nr:4Fe-4S binding protein [Rhodocyclaceae bacterium]
MHADVSRTPTARIDDRHRLVGPEARLRVDASACLPVRYADGQECGLCQAACPVHAIEMQATGPRLRTDCIGCGQCWTACPTGALNVDGFALPNTLALQEGDALWVDCWRVQFPESPRGALRVPCLAGIGAGWLLALFELAAAQGERPIILLDRGACENCAAGAGMATLRATLDEAGRLLSACGVGSNVLPRLTALPVAGRLEPTIPTSAGETRVDRRSFFRGLMGGLVRGAEQVAAASVGNDDLITLRNHAAPLEHMRIVTALTAIAGRHGRTIPAQALPKVSLGECNAHGVCAKVCPTGALVREDAGDAVELKFFAARCIACGQCARSCPDRAISVTAAGGNAVVEVLAHWQTRHCEVCGEAFVAATGATCAACTKHQQLFQGMTALFQPSA